MSQNVSQPLFFFYSGVSWISCSQEIFLMKRKWEEREQKEGHTGKGDKCRSKPISFLIYGVYGKIGWRITSSGSNQNNTFSLQPLLDVSPRKVTRTDVSRPQTSTNQADAWYLNTKLTCGTSRSFRFTVFLRTFPVFGPAYHCFFPSSWISLFCLVCLTSKHHEC